MSTIGCIGPMKDIVGVKIMAEKADVMYPPERIAEVVDAFQALLVQADNTGSSKSEITNAVDYTKFWKGLRREGSNLLGVTRHLLVELARAEQRIGALEGDQHDQIVYIQTLTTEIAQLKEDNNVVES